MRGKDMAEQWHELTPTQRELERSLFASECEVCPRCGAFFKEGTHYWSGTLKRGNPKDLAGVVCNLVNDPRCINPEKGNVEGDSWQKRFEKAGMGEAQD